MSEAEIDRMRRGLEMLREDMGEAESTNDYRRLAREYKTLSDQFTRAIEARDANATRPEQTERSDLG